MPQAHRLNPPEPDSTQKLAFEYVNWIRAQSMRGLDPNTVLMAAIEMAKVAALKDIASAVKDINPDESLSVLLTTGYPIEIKGEIEINQNANLDVALKTLYNETIAVKGKIDINR
ncbi:hypothetical protein FM036_37300 [Nostoc sp. HG1]|nr:hypothetical protein [Nostoc sp. HG1]